jgi:uncharacterized protein YecE (DUF72 family)
MNSGDSRRNPSLLIGCSGWNYPDTPEEGGGWTEVFYPDKETKRLRYYSQFFETAEMDSTFYNRFYSKMTKGTFIGMTKATPEKFQFSIKVPETITHEKRLDIDKAHVGSWLLRASANLMVSIHFGNPGSRNKRRHSEWMINREQDMIQHDCMK